MEGRARNATRSVAGGKRKSKVKVAILAIGIIFFVTFLIFLRLASTDKLENGQIKESGTHATLIANKLSLYNHFWNLQIKLD